MWNRFTKDGIKLKSGSMLEADIIVTATGLKILTGGSASLTVDGQAGHLRRENQL